ncbi:Mu transposase C-terminal domain-containing protein [Clostridium perfringens]
MIIAINDVLQLAENVLERVLWLDESIDQVYVINIFDSKASPTLKRLSEINSSLKEGLIKKVEDPYNTVYSEGDLSEKYKKVRDDAWDIISDLVKPDNEPEVYDSKKRGALVKENCDSKGFAKSSTYRHLKRFWQKGKTKNALLPDYFNCGNKSVSKSSYTKKVGSPRKNADIIGDGVNVDIEIEQIFKFCIDKYYKNSQKNSLTAVYNLMIKDFFAEKDEQGNTITDMSKIPTLRQFRYWYNKNKNIKEEVSSRDSLKRYQLTSRPVLGRSDYAVLGPTSEYQIDATIADVYIVSSYDRSKIIGRPVVYFVMDVFSRYIVGMNVSLEGPSWNGAMMALANTVADKVKFCKEYGIDIEPEQWVSKYLPDVLIADRGEIESSKIDTLINSLHVSVKNMPPYRADWKGIIEQNFRCINLNFKSMVAGTIKSDFRERGGHDYRLDAKLDINEFTKIMIKCVLYHNNSHYLKTYTRTEDMITDNVEPIPVQLWNWGIKHKSGQLRSFSEDIVKLNLMPKDTATVTFKGIKFKGMLYSCDKALKENWFDLAREKGSWKIEVSYDSRNMNNIYIRTNKGRDFEKCHLLEHQSRYLNKSLIDIQSLLESEKRQEDSLKAQVLQSKVDLLSDIEAIVKEAEKKTNSESNLTISKAKKLKDIRSNRASDKAKNREKDSFELDKRENTDNSIVYDFMSAQSESEFDDVRDTNIDEEDDIIDNISLLRKKQREALNNARRK